jgi:hypothetical protein
MQHGVDAGLAVLALATEPGRHVGKVDPGLDEVGLALRLPPLCLSGGLAAAYRPASARAFPNILPSTAARPDPIRGAWLVAIGAAAPEFPDVA